MKDGLIILSGGMDSTTLLYDNINIIGLAISFNYGSKHNSKEIPFAKYHCAKLNVKHIEIPLLFINEYFESSLLKTGNEIPKGHYEDENMKSTVVPFRNGIMLSVATGIAESNNMKRVLIGNHHGDHAIYPDCRKNFIDSMDKAMSFGTYNNIKIFAPYTLIDKRGIALIGKKLKIDYSRTWTCYEGKEKHCGKCGSCVERKEALYGFDNTEYEL